MMQQQEYEQQRPMRYKQGDRVRIIGGSDIGRSGEVVAVYPAHERTYLVKLNAAWYVHYPEYRLAPQPAGGASEPTATIPSGAGWLRW
jgi:ribosomal protein L24